MAKYVCNVCGYVYDEDAEGKKFEELDNEWVCPLCGVDKTNFSQEEE